MAQTTTALELGTAQRNLTHRDVDRGSTDPDVDLIQASRIADATVPDGGKGWIVVIGCAVLAWNAVGTSYCWGVIQTALVEDGLSSPAKLAFVGSLATGFISAFAIVNSRVVRFLGARKTALLGVSLMGLSQLLSSFATRNIGGLFVTAGAMMGLSLRYFFNVF